jgi:hypothetical protein
MTVLVAGAGGATARLLTELNRPGFTGGRTVQVVAVAVGCEPGSLRAPPG